jgi:hypothetical protein
VRLNGSTCWLGLLHPKERDASPHPRQHRGLRLRALTRGGPTRALRTQPVSAACTVLGAAHPGLAGGGGGGGSIVDRGGAGMQVDTINAFDAGWRAAVPSVTRADGRPYARDIEHPDFPWPELRDVPIDAPPPPPSIRAAL